MLGLWRVSTFERLGCRPVVDTLDTTRNNPSYGRVITQATSETATELFSSERGRLNSHRLHRGRHTTFAEVTGNAPSSGEVRTGYNRSTVAIEVDRIGSDGCIVNNLVSTIVLDRGLNGDGERC